MASHNGEMPYDWEQTTWNSQPRTMVLHWSPDIRYYFPYSDLQVNAAFHLWSATVFLANILQKDTRRQMGKMRNQTQSYTDLCISFITVKGV